MPLNIAPKTNPNNPTSQPAARPTTQINVPTQSTARAEALKQRLTQAQPPAPRYAGSTARAEAQAKQTRYPVPPLAAAAGAAPQAPTPAPQQRMSNVEPPPSGDPAVRAAQAAALEGQTPASPSTSAQPPTPAQLPPRAQAATSAEAPAAPAAISDAAQAQIATLARREQQIRKTQQELKAAQEAWKQEQAKYVPIDSLKSDPLKVLSEAGISYDTLVEQQIAQANPDPLQPLHDQIAALKAELAKVGKTFEERDMVAEQQAMKQYRNDAELLVESDPAYETIKATPQGVDDVVTLVRRIFDEEGILISVEEAAQQVEAKLAERAYEQYKKFGELSKVKARLAPPTPAAPAVTQDEGAVATLTEQQPVTPPTAKTLTNSGVVTRQMTARERAIARIKGEL